MKKRYKSLIVVATLATVIIYMISYLYRNIDVVETSMLTGLKDSISSKLITAALYVTPDILERRLRYWSDIPDARDLAVLQDFVINNYDRSDALIQSKSLTISIGKEDIKLNKYEILRNLPANRLNTDIYRSGYIDIYRDNLIVLTVEGFLFTSEIQKDEIAIESFSRLHNNLDDISDMRRFLHGYGMGFKDIRVVDDRIYVSFIDEIAKDCFQTGLAVGIFNTNKVVFKKIRYSEECISAPNSVGQSGGKIYEFDEAHILLSVGAYDLPVGIDDRVEAWSDVSQNRNSIFGKILQVNFVDESYKVQSLGHRNPQGLYYLPEYERIFTTDHGPSGGDEINSQYLGSSVRNLGSSVRNFGWPIVSYGNDSRYKRLRSQVTHAEKGFAEPVNYFRDSIGIGEIVRLSGIEESSFNDVFAVAAMGNDTNDGGLGIHLFQLENRTLTYIGFVEIGERVRDMKVMERDGLDKLLILFLETSGSVCLVNVDKVLSAAASANSQEGHRLVSTPANQLTIKSYNENAPQ